jgi:hypothetical protein
MQLKVVTQLEKAHSSMCILVIFIIAILIAGLFWGWWVLTDITSYIPQFLISAIFLVIFWGVGKNITSALGKKEQPSSEKIPPYRFHESFKNLAVHFLLVKGLPETPDSSDLRYLADNATYRAYLMHELPDWLAPAIKNHELKWSTYEDKKVLIKNLSNFTVYNNVIPAPETLGLTYLNGILVESENYSKIVSSLDGCRFDDLQLIIVKRRQFFRFVKRFLLIDRAENRVWLAPDYCFLLKTKGLLNADTLGMYFWEDCERYVRRAFKGFKYNPFFYPESKLLAKRNNDCNSSKA